LVFPYLLRVSFQFGDDLLSVILSNNLAEQYFPRYVGQESKTQSLRFMGVMAKAIMQYCKLGFVLTMAFLHLLSNRWLSELLVADLVIFIWTSHYFIQ
jgi:hypothetical protein